LIVTLWAWTTPQRQPVVRPERQIELPTLATCEPATATVPPLWLPTCGSDAHEPLSSTQA
jgi:hypothetical protein